MAFNLEKKELKTDWFYSVNENQFGPFELVDLIPKIEKETLVWREGIEWTKASEVPELNKFFEKKYSRPEQIEMNTQPIAEEKKNKISKSWVFAAIVFVGLVFFGYQFYKKETPLPVKPVSQDSGTVLNEFDIFDFEVIKKFKPSSNQMDLASLNLNQAREFGMRNDYYNAITKYKECLRNDPKAFVFMELLDMYWKVSDFDKCELCASMASNLDFQPRSEISKKLMLVHAVQNKFGLLTSEIRTQSTTDYSIMSFIDTDSLFRDFRKSKDYLSIIENNSISDSTSSYFNTIISYYNDLNYGSMNAFAYFSPQVEQYITMRNNVTPDDINVLWENNSEFLNGNSRIIGRRCFVTAPNKREVWIEFKCYRASKQKMQDCRVKVEFVFDEQGFIQSYKEVQVKDVKFI